MSSNHDRLDTAGALPPGLKYRDSHAEIWHDAEDGWLRVEWRGTQTLDSIKAVGNAAIPLMTALSVRKVLNDDTRTVGTWMSAIPWVAFKLLPAARAAGLSRAAHVYSPNRLARLSADAANLLIDLDSFNIQLFGSVEAAKEWLRSDATSPP